MTGEPGIAVARDSCRIAWRTDGNASGLPLVLLNSIGTDMSSWNAALPALMSAFHILRIDTRGHGTSDAPRGDYTMAELAADVRAAMDSAGFEKADVAGVSLGGMMAMQLALDFPDRVRALVLICTSATMDPAAWNDRIVTVRENGLEAIADMAISRFFSDDFAVREPWVVESVKRRLLAMSDAGYAGAGAAIRDMDLRTRLGSITQPTLVIAGEKDVSTPFDPHGAAIVSAIEGAVLRTLPSAHLSQIETPAEVAAAMSDFLCTAE